MEAETFDYIVVGAGSAGAVLAYRLSSSGSDTVLLLEAGGSDLSPYVLIPAGMLRMPPDKFWDYATEPDATRNGKVDHWFSGKVLGGGSSVNAMLWVRGNPADFDGWSDLGAVGWDYESLLPVMRKLETWEDGATKYRGGNGPQSVSRTRVRHPLVDRFIASACSAGAPELDDYNGERQLGVSTAQLSQRRGLRAGTGRSYLAPARHRRNLVIRTHATVDRVLFQDGRAVGVAYERGGQRLHASVRKEVLVSAGAVASPAILQRSGVGDPELLAQYGIEVVSAQIGVGRGLQEHPTFSVLFDVSEKTLNQSLNAVDIAKAAASFVVRRRGLATATLALAVMFDKVDRGTGAPDYEIMFAPMTSTSSRPGGLSEAGSQPRDTRRPKMSKEPVIGLHVSVLHPHGRGTVQITSRDPKVLPTICLEYYRDPRDLQVATAAARRIREIVGTPPLANSVVAERAATRSLETDADWHGYFARDTFNAAHWAGSVAMGAADDPTVALDPELRVKGVRNLRVVDASVMPTLTSGNTNATAILIAEKCAELITSVAK